MGPELQWIDDTDSITCQSTLGLVFRDTREHWSHAVCRLLSLKEEGRARVETVGVECFKSFQSAPFSCNSEQRLLRGFFGTDLCRFAQVLKGSDLFAVVQKESE